MVKIQFHWMKMIPTSEKLISIKIIGKFFFTISYDLIPKAFNFLRIDRNRSQSVMQIYQRLKALHGFQECKYAI